jgi:hypothetical protein
MPIDGRTFNAASGREADPHRIEWGAVPLNMNMKMIMGGLNVNNHAYNGPMNGMPSFGATRSGSTFKPHAFALDRWMRLTGGHYANETHLSG